MLYLQNLYTCYLPFGWLLCTMTLSHLYIWPSYNTTLLHVDHLSTMLLLEYTDTFFKLAQHSSKGHNSTLLSSGFVQVPYDFTVAFLCDLLEEHLDACRESLQRRRQRFLVKVLTCGQNLQWEFEVFNCYHTSLICYFFSEEQLLQMCYFQASNNKVGVI